MKNHNSRIALHGMYHSINFGDVVYGRAYCDWVEKLLPGANVVFPWAARAVLEDIFYDNKQRATMKILPGFSNVIYTGGHYLNDGGTFRGALSRFRHILAPGLFCWVRGVPYSIIGAGAGPIDTNFGRIFNRFFVNKADFVAVRDKVSLDVLGAIGCCRPIYLTSDAVITYVRELIPTQSTPLRRNKRLALHISNVDEELITAINLYLRNFEKDYEEVVFLMDKPQKYNVGHTSVFSIPTSIRKIEVPYQNHYKMIEMINECDDIISTKLHVAVAGVARGKRVFSYAFNYQKVSRFFQSIGGLNRCLNAGQFPVSRVYDALADAFQSEPIVLGKDILVAASKNKEYLTTCVQIAPGFSQSL